MSKPKQGQVSSTAASKTAAATKENGVPPAAAPVSPGAAGGTLEPTMRERILAAFGTSTTRSLKWWELVELCGPKAKGDMFIQLSPLGTLDHNVKVWYGVSKEFHDAIGELRDEKRVRLFPSSPVGYFPGAQTPPIPLAHDYKIAYPSARLFITSLELSS